MRNSALFLLVLLLAGCGSSPKVADKPKEPVRAPETFRAKFSTTKGDFTVEVHRDWAPHGADHLYALLGEHYYDEAKFYRVVRRFVVQWGINKDPKVDRLWRQLQIPDDPVKQKNLRGTLTFATRGPNSRSTELFINLADNTVLDKDGFAPVGKVIEGMEVVDALNFVYGDITPRGSGPDPKLAQEQGNIYFDRMWPRLDAIKTAAIVP